MPDRGKWSFAAPLAWAAMLAAPAASSAAVTVTLGPSNLKAPILEYIECGGCQSGVVMNVSPGAGVRLTAPADGTVRSWGAVGNIMNGGLALFVLHAQADGSLTYGSATADAAAVDGTPNAASLALGVGDSVAIRYFRELPFETSHVRLPVVSAPGASWVEPSYYQEGRNILPSELMVTPNAQFLYNATVELFPPGLSTVSPSSGAAGTVVTITGQHLAVATGVTFGGVPATSFSGDDEHLTAIAPPRPAGGAVDVQVTTAGGTTVALPADLFTYPSTIAAPLIQALADRTAPSIGSLSLSPASFRAANLGASVIASRVGTRVSDRLSEPARTTFAVQRVLAGRRSGKHCVAPSRSNRGKRRCTRLKSVRGSFTRTAAAGANSFTFTGRIGGKALRRGSYRLVATAVDAAGNRSKPAARAFSIVR